MGVFVRCTNVVNLMVNWILLVPNWGHKMVIHVNDHTWSFDALISILKHSTFMEQPAGCDCNKFVHLLQAGFPFVPSSSRCVDTVSQIPWYSSIPEFLRYVLQDSSSCIFWNSLEFFDVLNINHHHLCTLGPLYNKKYTEHVPPKTSL